MLLRAQAYIQCWLWRFGRDCRGQDLVEYALLVAGIGMVGYGVLPTTIQPAIKHIFDRVLEVFQRLTGYAA